MTTTITAIYKDGVLRPLRPLSIPENTTVTIAIEPTNPWLTLAESEWIDGIDPTVDPALYARAAELGEWAHGLHAWQLLPMQYTEGTDGQPKRRRDYAAEGLDPLDYLQEYALVAPDVPEDFAENLDHYLYGLPKRTDYTLHDGGEENE